MTDLPMNSSCMVRDLLTQQRRHFLMSWVYRSRRDDVASSAPTVLWRASCASNAAHVVVWGIWEPPARSAIERASSILYAFMMVAGACCAEYLLGTSEIYRRSDSKEIIQAVSAENCGAVVGNCCSSFYNSCRRFRSAFRIWGSNCKNVVDWCCLDARVGCLWRRDWNVMAIGNYRHRRLF